MNQEMLTALLDSIIDPIVFVDTEHVIRYINKKARENYCKKGTDNMVGNSLFIYHTERSKKIILDIFESFKKGLDEKYLTINDDNKKAYMRAVRDNNGNLLGYYERFEKV